MVTRASSCGMIVDYLPSSYTTTYLSKWKNILWTQKDTAEGKKKHLAILVLPELKPQTQQLETKLSVDSMHLTLDITPGLLAFSCEHKAPGPTTLRLRSVYCSTPGLRLNRCKKGALSKKHKTQIGSRIFSCVTRNPIGTCQESCHTSEVFFEVLDSSWTMANYGKLWQTMANYGKLWQIMANYGITMANYGKLWQTMANYGKLWQTMAYYGITMANYGCIADALLMESPPAIKIYQNHQTNCHQKISTCAVRKWPWSDCHLIWSWWTWGLGGRLQTTTGNIFLPRVQNRKPPIVAAQWSIPPT